MDAVRAILDHNAGRDPERLALKFAKMRKNPFAFLRGSTHLFHARLQRADVPKSAPMVWCCGDLHLENFGSYQGANGLAYFDINDFDEAALAPATVDPLHLLTSLWLGACEIGLGDDHILPLARAAVDAYAGALADGKPYWLERQTATGPVRLLLDQVGARSQADLLDRRCTGTSKRRRLRVDGRHALPASEAQQVRVRAALADALPAPAFEVLDVARRVAGTGSLGLDRYVVLARGEGGRHGQQLLDLKPARPSTLARFSPAKQPHWKSDAQREVALQQRMQAVSMEVLVPLRCAGLPYVLRVLQPGEDRLDLGSLSHHQGGGLQHSLATMGRLMAWAQLRSSGRDGSASADALIAFGRRGQGAGKWRDRLVALSHETARQVRRDAALFNEACAHGLLDV